MKNKKILAYIAAGIGASSIAGYGLGIGRDSWRFTKKNVPLIIALLILSGVLALPFLGGRNLLRGYPERSFFAGFIGTLWALLMICFGVIIAAAIVFVLGIILEQQPQDAIGFALSVAFIVGSASLVLGLVVGLLQRPSRRRKFAIAASNEAFLEKMGFIETGEEEITHYDGSGNPLRLLERTKDTMVFIAVGRRNRRAYIKLEGGGLMTGYSGVIGINDARNYNSV